MPPFVIKLREIRPVLYSILLVLAVVGTYVYKLRTQGIFACTAEGYYPSDRYLGECTATAYGDYDHGAFWFGLEPKAQRFAATAEVLFLGSSRMEFAFSTVATDKWFSEAAVRHYVMGFTSTENVTFTAPLLARLKPQAKFYVINVDRFFNDTETEPGGELLHGGSDVRSRYGEKKLWQHLHRSLCTRLRAICGKEFAYYRTRETGHWITSGVNRNEPALVADGPISDQDHWDHYAALATRFISALPVDRSCVLLTVVPSRTTKRAEARAIAAAVGMDLVEPPLEDLRTFDGSHLDMPSAERWSQAFYDIAGPRIKRCLDQGGSHTAVAG
jgi:hypothetical protein